MKRHRIYMAFLLLFLSLCAWQGDAMGDVMGDPDNITYAPLRFEPPKTQRVELKNGIILHMLEDHELPLVNISAVVRMGSFYDPPGKEGVAKLTGTVMRTGGTGSMTGDQLDEELDFIAGLINVSVETESCTVSLSVPQDDLDRGLKIFSDILMNPAFEEEKVITAKAIETEALRRIRDNPQQTAFREFRRLIYRGDPRGRISSIESIERVKRDDLIVFHRQFFRPSNLMIAVSGDVQSKDMVDNIRATLGEWNAPGGPGGFPPPPVYAPASLDYFFKDTPQSIVLVGHPAPGKESSDFYAFEVLDFIIGSGGFRSRIFGEVRNRLGLAYSAGSFYSSRPHYGIFGAYAMANASSTLDALSAMTNILNEVKKKGAHPDELAWAKQSIINNFIFSFATPDRIAVGQMMLEHDGLPDNLLTSYKNNIERVELDDLRAVASRYLSDKSRVVLVLGDKKRFNRPLSSFGDFRVTQDNAGDGQ
ncbi:MAG: pitrilysin family protein [Syntrophales bacterium]|nr:pitrilysin family protein [Syntrophales bacterium]